MMKLFTFLSASAFIILIACSDQSDTKSESQNTQVQESVAATTYYYTCPMEEHKNIAATTPGSCPECGMKLVAAQETLADSADYFGCPMPEHSHVRHDEPGNCEECGMALKPMRLIMSEGNM